MSKAEKGMLVVFIIIMGLVLWAMHYADTPQQPCWQSQEGPAT